jgi:hypothetical protein
VIRHRSRSSCRRNSYTNSEASRPGCGNARGLRTHDTDVQVYSFPSPIEKPRSKGWGRCGVSYLHVRRKQRAKPV